MSEPTNPEEAVRRGLKVEAFLKDPVIRQAIEDLEQDNYAFFTNAHNSDLRVTAWAKANALASFAQELRRIVDAGKRSAAEIDKAEKSNPRR